MPFSDPFGVSNDYYAMLARIESNNDPFARARSSTASGLFQFTRGTWEGLGGQWGGQSGQAFGGLRPDPGMQRRMVETLTGRNAGYLAQRNIPINNATLYGAHFLGAGGAASIFGADPNTPIEQVTTAAQRRANPSILRGTAGDFFAWLERKTGMNPFRVGSAETDPTQSVPHNTGLFGSGGFLDRITVSPGEVAEHTENGIKKVLDALGDPAKRVGFVVFGLLLAAIAIFVILRGPQVAMGLVGAGVTKGKSLAKGAAMEAVA